MSQLSNEAVYDLSIAEFQRKILVKALAFALENGVDFSEEVGEVNYMGGPAEEADCLKGMLEDMKGQTEGHHGMCL